VTSLAEELKAYRPSRPRCSFGVILEALSDDDRATVVSALGSPIPGTHIAKVLTSRGHPLKGETVQRHRKGDCSCPRDDG
jgi:hypothetical protein